MPKVRYNHAFSVSFSFDTDLSYEEYLEYMQTKKGLAELTGNVIHRAMRILEDNETEAYDLWDTYELPREIEEDE